MKLTITLVSLYFIYLKVISRSGFDEMLRIVREQLDNKDSIRILCLVGFLMFLNWFTESMKWWILLARIQPISILGSLRSVMSGVTVSIFTPNRIGEFAGRVMHLEPGNRVSAAIGSVIGSMNQLLITIIAGCVAVLISNEGLEVFNLVEYHSLQVIVVLIIIITTVAFFRISGIYSFIKHWHYLDKMDRFVKVFAIYRFRDLFIISVLSIIRYVIFTAQFILLLRLFDITIPVAELARMIALIYFVIALVPTFALSELSVRGSVALFFLSPVTGNSTGIVAATSLLWLINLAVPAAIGAVTAWYFRISK